MYLSLTTGNIYTSKNYSQYNNNKAQFMTSERLQTNTKHIHINEIL